MKKMKSDMLKKVRQSVCAAATFLSFLLVCGAVEASADTYEYDDLNRVTKVIYEDGSSTAYEYDANGNIKSQTYKEKEEEGTGGSGVTGGQNGGGQGSATDQTGGQNRQEGSTQEKSNHKEGMKATSQNATYIITSVSEKTATFNKLISKKKKSYSVPNQVEIDGITYTVTKIEAKAFKNNKKLKKVTIGKNITSIGKQAFYGCNNLKTITIKSTKLKSVGKQAFKGIHKKATIKVPKKKYKKYKKLLKGKGQKKTVKIKKM